MAQRSDEEEDDHGCDLFADSEREDVEEANGNSKPVRERVAAITWPWLTSGPLDSFLTWLLVFAAFPRSMVSAISFMCLEIIALNGPLS